MSLFSSLKKEQKEAVGLLQIGTFLEYFDLMLYVHMAVLLNDLFFPKTDPHTTALLSAFAFCSTYVLRPFGALLFGYIGDYIGRKTTVIITTTMMAVSCIVMASLPTYAQIGIASAWAVTLCRIVQGLSSMGEIIGAEIYLTEMTKPPERYPCVALIGCSARFGTMMALGMATLVLSLGVEWRIAFWLGAGIAMIGSVARARLRETPDFVDMKKRRSKMLKHQNKFRGKSSAVSDKLLDSSLGQPKEKIDWKTFAAFFLISSGPPACLYFTYIYCSNIYKEMGFSGEHVISQNFIVSIVEFLGILYTVFLSYKIHPLKILKIKTIFFIVFLVFCPYLLYQVKSSFFLLGIQMISVCFTLSGVPAVATLLIHFPIFKRFTYASFIYALSRALMYVGTSFGLVYLTEGFGHWGLWFIMLPTSLGFLWGVLHFEKLEREAGSISGRKASSFFRKGHYPHHPQDGIKVT
jgi:MFS transporter, MHS family, proline/betaine transporter